jgi:diguanylate cyclase (GGDEF)-like protein/PAS domain S-box-containing protein
MAASLNALTLNQDPYDVDDHGVRSAHYVRLVAYRVRDMGHYTDILTDEWIEVLSRATPLHDIGKVTIPDQILLKEGKLSQADWNVVQTHALMGEAILETTAAQLEDSSAVLNMAITVAGSHHEKWDGTGYPRGLNGEQIPLAARLVSLVDMYDALVSFRAYKRCWKHSEAIEEIVRHRHTSFESVLVDAFLAQSDAIEQYAKGQSVRSLQGRPWLKGGAIPYEHTPVQQTLVRFEERFEQLFKNSPVGLAMVDQSTQQFCEVNQALLTWTGYSREEFISMRFWDITPEEFRVQDQQQLEDLKREGRFGPNQKEYIRRDGSRFPIRISGFKLIDVNGKPVVWGMIENLSEHLERIKLEKKLADNVGQLKTLVHAIPDVVWFKDTQERFQFCNARFEAYFGATEEQIVGQKASSFVDNDRAQMFRVGDQLAVEQGTSYISEEWVTFASDGHKELLEVTKSPVYSEDGKLLGVLGIGRDVSRRRQLEEQTKDRAFFDGLTKLPNRYLLEDRLKIATNNSKRSLNYCALLFMDLDSFKGLNDQHGHIFGDVVLREAASRLLGCVREVDTVARFGGDEFVVVLNQLHNDLEYSIESARRIAEKMRIALALPYLLSRSSCEDAPEAERANRKERYPSDRADIVYQGGTSIGVVMFLGDEVGQLELFTQADNAMYHAKKSGGNSVCFYSDNQYKKTLDLEA